MSLRLIGRFALLGILAASAGPASAQAPRPFEIPKDRASWEARRAGLRDEVIQALGAATPARRFVLREGDARPGPSLKRFSIEVVPPTEGGPGGVLILPGGADPSRRVPLIVHVGAPWRPGHEAVDAPGLDGRAPAVALAAFGFATLAIDADPVGSTHLRDLQAALGVALDRPEVDLDRVGVIGLGPAGPVALALMAIDDRVDCGSASVELRDFTDVGTLFGRVPPEGSRAFDGPTFVDLLAALCAPRPLGLSYGERLPLPTRSAGRRLEGGSGGSTSPTAPRGPASLRPTSASSPGTTRSPPGSSGWPVWSSSRSTSAPRAPPRWATTPSPSQRSGRGPSTSPHLGLPAGPPRCRSGRAAGAGPTA